MQKRVLAYYLGLLDNDKKFSRADLLEAMHKSGMEIGEASFKAKLQKHLKDGSIVRVGRNAYCVAPEGVSAYTYEYSDHAKSIAKQVVKNCCDVDFTILEMVQLNEFVDSQYKDNVIFLSVEHGSEKLVFDILRDLYPGKVLINPTTEMYHQYWYEDMIVVGRLISEAPMGQDERWNTRIEKLLVDVFANQILKSNISKSELPNIYEGAFSKYVVDESCMFRYAKRRGVDKRIREFIKENTDIQLRVG